LAFLVSCATSVEALASRRSPRWSRVRRKRARPLWSGICRSLIPTFNNNSRISRARLRATPATGRRRRNRSQFSITSFNNKVRFSVTFTDFVSAYWSAWFVRRSHFSSRKSANQPALSRRIDDVGGLTNEHHIRSNQQ